MSPADPPPGDVGPDGTLLRAGTPRNRALLAGFVVDPDGVVTRRSWPPPGSLSWDEWVAWIDGEGEEDEPGSAA
jgi:hypothetical protein